MDSVAEKVTEILNKTDPVYVDVLESSEIVPTYEDIENLWKYFFDRRNKQIEVNPRLEGFLKKFPALENLFKAHCNYAGEHMFLTYCMGEDEHALIRYKDDHVYHFLMVKAPPLVKICQDLVDRKDNRLAIIIWVR